MSYKGTLFLLLCLHISTITSNYNTFHRYLWAAYNHTSGNFNTAQDWYKIIQNNHHSLCTDKGFISFLFDTKQYTRIVELMPSLEKKFEKDAEIQLLFIIALEKNNQKTLADNKLISICSSFKHNADIALRATHTYIQRKEPENALLTIDAFLNNNPRKPNNFIFYYIKTQVTIQLNKYKEALENIAICLDIHPQFDKGWLLHATLNEQQGKLQEAITGYTIFLELTGAHPLIEKHLASLQFRNKQIIAFSKSYLEQALSFFEKKQYSESLAILSQLFKHDQNNEQAQTLHIKLLAHLEQYQQLEELCCQLLQKTSCDNKNIPKTIHMLSYSQIPYKPLISLLQNLSKKHTANYWISLYTADLCIRNNQIDDAIISLQLSIKPITDKKLKAQIFHQLALLNYEQEHYDAMRSYLEQGYGYDPAFDHLNNSLAYYWATKGKDTTKAQKFLNDALQKQKNNPNFIDTQATIFYKEKKYEQAQQLLEPFSDTHGPSLLRLAKIHYALNNKDGATACIQKAELLVHNAHDKKQLLKLQQKLSPHDQ